MVGVLDVFPVVGGHVLQVQAASRRHDAHVQGQHGQVALEPQRGHVCPRPIHSSVPAQFDLQELHQPAHKGRFHMEKLVALTATMRSTHCKLTEYI
jgi:hypothetical protein